MLYMQTIAFSKKVSNHSEYCSVSKLFVFTLCCLKRVGYFLYIVIVVDKIYFALPQYGLP